MSKRVLSAKDRAFEKERAAFRKALREKESENRELALKNYQLRQQVKELERKLYEKEGEIELLTEKDLGLETQIKEVMHRLFKEAMDTAAKGGPQMLRASGNKSENQL